MKKSFNMLFVFMFVAVCVGLPRAVLPAPSLDVIEITRDGKSTAVIVIPENAHRTEEYAAEELQKYLGRISGAEIQIVTETAESVSGVSHLFIGNVGASEPLREQLAGLDADAFLVQAQPRSKGESDIFLLGKTERATLWAAYDFLESELGCRWLAPGELWEIIPERADIQISAGSRVEEPSMKYRPSGLLGRGLIEGPGYRDDFTTHSLRRRVNVAKRINMPFEWAPERAQGQLRLPIDVRAWYNEHGAPPILRASSRDNSEWFAMTTEDGVRSRPRAHWQMCFSHPEARDLLADKLSRMLREHPEWEFVEVGCTDGLSVNYCRCNGCADLDIHGEMELSRRAEFTHRWLALINAVADGLAESDPGRILQAAAYGSYQAPPDPGVIRPAQNVRISYYTWSGCRLHGYEHGLHNDVPEDQAARHAGQRRWIHSWLDMTPGGMTMVEYLGRGSMDGITGTNPRRYIKDISYVHRKGFEGYQPYDYPSNWGMRTLNRYAVARAMWNADIDPDEVVRDFCDHAFGAGSEHMQKFVNVIQDAMLEADCGNSYCVTWIQPEVVAEARRHLEAARAAVSGGDENDEKRLYIYEMHFRYAELAGRAMLLQLLASRTRDPELLREAIQLGQQAADYRREKGRKYPRNKYPEFQFGTSASIGQRVQEGGSWHALLERLEREALRASISELAEDDGDEAVAGLVEALHDAVEMEDVRAQRDAARALGRSGDTSALPGLRDALAAAEEEMPDDRTERGRKILIRDLERAVSRLEDDDQ